MQSTDFVQDCHEVIIPCSRPPPRMLPLHETCLRFLFTSKEAYKSEQDFQHQYICLSDRYSIASCTFDSFTIWTIIGEVMQDLIRALHTIKYFFRVNFIVANNWFEFFNILTHLFFHFTPGIEHTDICNVTECVCVRACGRDGGNLLNCETPWSVPVSRSLAHLVSFFVIVFASAAVKHQRRPLARP